ncbi:MAG: autoinducer synthase [Paracoccaceae bacterium]|nr:autoinducer synthase [Paracoccaceae bacterium]
MLRYIYGRELHAYPKLRQSMFRDRAIQFSERLGWNVKVDSDGLEQDAYDALNPLYVIWPNDDGSHGGSMRFLPTVGRTMLNDHFLHLLGGEAVKSPLIWECTRFCLMPGAGSDVTDALVLGAGEVMEHFHLMNFVGVYDARMERVYRRIGLRPDVIGSDDGTLRVGLWQMNSAKWPAILERVGIDRATSKQWLRQAFRTGHLPRVSA